MILTKIKVIKVIITLSLFLLYIYIIINKYVIIYKNLQLKIYI